MEKEPGDDYIRRYASIIRAHEQRLADWRARRPGASQGYFLNPFSWGAPSSAATGANTNANANARGGASAVRRPPPTVLSLDPHHLYYLLIRFEALGIEIGTLDIRLRSTSRPLSYPALLALKDRSDTRSVAASFTSTFSAVSKLSLGGGWWGRPEPASVDSELKYIYSAFTKVPGLSLKANDLRVIGELADDPPVDNAVPMYAFKSLQTLEILDLDPRMLLGWDHLAEVLGSLTIKRSGMEDVTDVLVDAVLDDATRREKGWKSSSPTRGDKASRFGSGRFRGRPTVAAPDAVAEDSEAVAELAEGEDPPPKNLLPRRKWLQLRHLSLADNALTFFPSAILPSFASLTHLDLSSNLLVSVPPGLSALYNLVSLNLSDNMIDSVLGIYQNLGQVLTVNLSKNRLDSLCGLERLAALERIDLQDNHVEDPGEVGRLAVLPNISQVWIEGNPMTKIHENYRVQCFEFFAQEGKTISLDGAPPSFLEARSLQVAVSPPPPSSSSGFISHTSGSAPSPPIVAVGSMSPLSPQPIRASNAAALGSSSNRSSVVPVDHRRHPSHPSLAESIPSVTSPSPKPHKRRVAKRVVDLDGNGNGTTSDVPSDSSPLSLAPKRSGHRRGASEGHDSSSSPGAPANGNGTGTGGVATSTSSPAQLHDGADVKVSEPVITVQRKTKKKGKAGESRHGRYATEGSTGQDVDDDVSTRMAAVMSLNAPTHNHGLQSTKEEDEGDTSSVKSGNKGMSEADVYRARIDALRQEVGDSWLKVLSQSGGALPSPTSPSPSNPTSRVQSPILR